MDLARDYDESDENKSGGCLKGGDAFYLTVQIILAQNWDARDLKAQFGSKSVKVR